MGICKNCRAEMMSERWSDTAIERIWRLSLERKAEPMLTYLRKFTHPQDKTNQINGLCDQSVANIDCDHAAMRRRAIEISRLPGIM